jgi:hypothetical protein
MKYKVHFYFRHITYNKHTNIQSDVFIFCSAPDYTLVGINSYVSHSSRYSPLHESDNEWLIEHMNLALLLHPREQFLLVRWQCFVSPIQRAFFPLNFS